MFEFTGRLKTFSIILMVIGVISIGASFFLGGGDHHAEDEHGHAAQEHEGVQHEDHEDYDTKEEPDAFTGSHGEHSGDYSDVGIKKHEDGENENYHKTAARAVPAHNHYYATANNEHHDAEHIHHQQQNLPWANLMVNNFFFLAIALGTLFFMAVQYAAQVGWTAVLLRIMEAISSFLWIPLVIMLILVLTGVYHIGGNHLWHWMAEGIMTEGSENYDAIIAGKEGYLNDPFFIIRTLIYAFGWIGAAFLLRKMSLKVSEGSVDPAKQWKKMRNLSAGFLVFFAITSSTSSWDWIMSIDTHWFSTLFGWYTFATMFVAALTAITMVTLYLRHKGYLPFVNDSHIHDLGKFMFAFSIFWTYLWFSQYMLIWYSDIPEEVTYFMVRFDDYKVLFLTMVALNFIFPVLVLMSRDSKRNYGFLMVTGIVILFGHWLDIFLMIMPGSVGAQWELGLVQIGTLLGFAGLFIFAVFSALSKRKLLLENHPMLVESKHFHI